MRSEEGIDGLPPVWQVTEAQARELPLEERQGASGDTMLIAAVKLGRSSLVSTLLRRGAPTAARNDAGSTALLTAVEYPALSETQRADMVRLLISGGAAPGCMDKWGTTALIRAAERGNMPMVRLLLDLGVVSTLDHMSQLSAAVAEAALGGHTAIQRLLLTVKAPISPGGLVVVEQLAAAATESNKLKQRRAAAIESQHAAAKTQMHAQTVRWQLQQRPDDAELRRLGPKHVEARLDWAVEQGFITQRQRNSLKPALLLDIVDKRSNGRDGQRQRAVLVQQRKGGREARQPPTPPMPSLPHPLPPPRQAFPVMEAPEVQQAAAGRLLVDAIRNREHGVARKLLGEGAALEVGVDTALMAAVRLCDDGGVETAMLLLDLGAPTATLDANGNRALSLAVGVHHGQPCPLIARLLSRGREELRGGAGDDYGPAAGGAQSRQEALHAIDTMGNTPLIIACGAIVVIDQHREKAAEAVQSARWLSTTPQKLLCAPTSCPHICVYIAS